MKKMRVMVLSLVVAISLMGAGYAAWGNKIISTTNLKTGNWKVVIDESCCGRPTASDQTFLYNYDAATGKYVDHQPAAYTDYEHDTVDENGKPVFVDGDSWVYTLQPKVSDEGKAVEFNFLNMHPGTKARTKFQINNEGSIPAKIGDVNVEYTDSIVAQEMMVHYYFCFDWEPDILTDDVVISGDCKLSELKDTLKAQLTGQEIYPEYTVRTWFGDWNIDNEDMTNKFYFYLPGNALNGNVGQNTNVPVKISFDFVQYNEVK